MESCYRSQKIICTKEEENLPFVQNRNRKGARVLERSVEKRVYSTIEITMDITKVVCAKER